MQSDIKRMLAYSSISHAGFVLLGLQAATARGIESSLYYLFVYTFMVIGSFAVVTVVGGRGDTSHDLDRYRGLAAAHPLLAGSLAVLLMAQAGIPFTTGFLAKLEVISASVGAGSTALAVVAMVSAAVAAFFYLRVILLMYMPASGVLSPVPVGVSASGSVQGAWGIDVPPAPPESGEGAGNELDTVGGEDEAPDDAGSYPSGRDDLLLPGGITSAIALCVAVTVLFGVWPAPVLDFAHRAALLFLPH